MDKLNMQTKDLANDKFEKFKELFPNAITETIDEDGNVIRAIDKDILAQEISTKVVEGKEERYQFTWPDKRKAILTANSPISKTLRPCREESVNFDETENLYIEGDNLEVLKLLQETYLGKIKMIYIDPPYNTGNDFFYNDNFHIDKDNYLTESGQFDNYGDRLEVNLETSGRFHTDWLNMLYPRLKLARNLLTNDGVIFISIDDNELSNLKKICDEIFGEDNYINTISLFSKVSAGASGGGEDRKLKKNMEYILFYAKNSGYLGALPSIFKKTKLNDYISQMKKDGKSFKYTNVLYKEGNKEFYKTIKDGSGGNIDIFKVKDYEIKTVKQIAREENISEDDVYIKYYDKIMTTTNAQTSIRDRVWESTDSENNMYIASYVPISGKNKGKRTEIIFVGRQKVLVIWLKDTAHIENGVLYKKEKIGTYWDGFSWINVTKEGSIRFENGKKPISLLQQLINLISNKEEMIVLDFFSGSASTAHAVIQENLEKKLGIKFILVQIPEEIMPINKNNKKYINYLKNEGINPYVTEVGKERIRRVGNKINTETNKVDFGFRVFKTDTSNMKNVYYSPNKTEQHLLDLLSDNIKEDRTNEDLLFQVMLDLGISLSSSIQKEKIDNKNVYVVADGFLIACFDQSLTDEIVKKIAKKEPYYAVFRDSSMATDSVATNFDQIFENISPKTIRKVL